MVEKLTKLYKEKIKFRHKLFVAIVLLVLVLVAIGGFFNENINPVIILTSEAKVKALSTTAVYDALTSVLSENFRYEDLIKVQTADDGTVNFLQTNGIEINALGNRLAQETQMNLDQIGQQTVNIPLGNLTAIPIFSGQGPKIEIKLMPIGIVTCRFTSEFVNAGINQTNHRIYMYTETLIHLILPTAFKTINTSVQVLLCESIIVGKIPATYLNSTDLDTMLNLID